MVNSAISEDVSPKEIVMNSYDYILVTNQPSFYKVRLWNQISSEKRVLLVFLSERGNDRNSDFVREEARFDHLFLSKSKLKKIIQSIRLLSTCRYGQLIIGGWDEMVLRLLPFLSPKKKNAFLCESSIYEYSPHLLKGLFKRIILQRFYVVYAAGIAQSRLLKELSFKGKTIMVGGCGLLNYIQQPPYQYRDVVHNYLFVGRLVNEKNLDMLIAAFKDLQHLNLTIIGFGEEENRLKASASDNIFFTGAIDNIRLSEYYQKADVFILPSITEPWGLVVEEALNNGIPVIVSDRVGCRDDLVSEKNGIVFPYSDIKALKEAIIKMTDIEYYNTLRVNISQMNFIARGQHQIEIFTKGKYA